MEADYSLDALLKFIEYARDKGLVNKTTGRNWRSAIGQLLNNLPPEELADVRKVDLDAELRKVINQGTNDMSPKTMNTYVTRAKSAIQQFSDYSNDPAAYKPQAPNRGRISSNEKQKSPNNRVTKRSDNPKSEENKIVPDSSSTDTHANSDKVDHNMQSLNMLFPLRQDFIAQLVIPRDLSIDEARRLGAFVMTLAVDYKPSSS